MNKSPFIDTDIKNPKIVIGSQTRVALFGGTFDPPTIAHIFMGQKITDLFHLDKVYFIPCADPYHKSDSRQITDFEVRYEMLRVALSNMSSQSLSILKYNDPEVTRYSINTVNEFLKEYPECKGNIFFVIGTDSYNDIVYWKDNKSLLKLVHLIVIKRYDVPELAINLPDHVVFVGLPSTAGISSTNVRFNVKHKYSINHLVTQDVNEFIVKHNLYSKES